MPPGKLAGVDRADRVSAPRRSNAGFFLGAEHCSSELAKLAEEAAGQWTAQFNPRPITASDFEAIYAAAL